MESQLTESMGCASFISRRTLEVAHGSASVAATAMASTRKCVAASEYSATSVADALGG